MAKLIDDKIYDRGRIITGDSKNFYSKANPHGPYQSTHRPDADNAPPAQYFEGAPTARNLRDWAEWASKNSGPAIAPGIGRKGESGRQRKPAANKP